MDKYSSQPPNQSTFGRSLMTYIASKLPYSGFNVLDVTARRNPKYEVFDEIGVRRPEALARNSVTQDTEFNKQSIGEIRNVGFQDYMYANIQPDKGPRLSDYRIMAAFAEVSNALDEVCDEIINPDLEGRVCTIDFKDIDLTPVDRQEIEKEFSKYCQYFDLEHKGWSYFRDLLIESELFFEHIIHKDHVEEGILGIVRVPSELMDPVYNNIQNMMIKGFLYRKPIFEDKNSRKKMDEELVPMQENQVMYVNSGIWNEQKTARLPFIENARRAYRQLSLVEDSILIYRMVRAPEKLVFNVDVGNMPPPKAEAYLRKLMQQYWNSKTFDPNQNSIVQKFNPQSMLDSFWFPKRTGSEGTSVTQLAGGANLGELTDLMYFVKKLYEALKVPVNRLDPASTFQGDANILREELKFARFIMRTQQLFAAGLKKGFITHLQLKKMWKRLHLKEYNLIIKMNPPSNFYELRESQKLELKVSNFNSLGQNPTISPTYMQKRLLGWNDIEIKANREFLRKDKEFAWELAQIEAAGPGWKAAQTQAQNASSEAEGGEAAGSAAAMGIPPGAPGISGLPPEFGGAAATPETAGAGAPAPEGAGAAPAPAATPAA